MYLEWKTNILVCTAAAHKLLRYHQSLHATVPYRHSC